MSDPHSEDCTAAGIAAMNAVNFFMKSRTIKPYGEAVAALQELYKAHHAEADQRVKEKAS